ncbi:nucleoside-diphosphate sugar epimerase/dehydratase [Deinococcus rubellus]|uniref:Polysaccharide biosynthesis protein n=1 Tax=Deinococcus rubellus TaxID=1889240 RepID=A0ABY5YE47_9DEIO|nr:nucleoside-diphosphate sugar epimerase/dehydratase [Deinococcus rubellus]UWX63115.1 polysaccharide biosynthesis protein [Deinococcus rubellus]
MYLHPLGEDVQNRILKYAIDLSIWTLAVPLAFALRLNVERLPERLNVILIYTLVGLLINALVLGLSKPYLRIWHRVSLTDLQHLARMVALVGLLMLFVTFLLPISLDIPRSIPVISTALALIGMSAVRVLARTYVGPDQKQQGEGFRKRTLIVGAGEAGTMLAREMLNNAAAGFAPVGFLDDDPVKAGRLLLGLPIHGPLSTLAQVAQQLGVQEVVIAMPSVQGALVRQLTRAARAAHLHYRILPSLGEILQGQDAILQLRDVNVEDLLRRAPVHLDMDSIARYVEDRTVLVTGAGGSIGSEIVRQVARFRPRQIVLLGRGENSIFSIQQELKMNWPEVATVAIIADVRRRDRLRQVFAEYRPEVVYHAAANKHVPLMEAQPGEAVLNNVFGTQNIAELCLDFQVQRLVNISTDKAVNPSSVMGSTKRLAEMVVSAAAQRAEPGQAFMSVRFGNVLGSRGSVVPTFMAQIRAGGPVAVTHPDMVRFFMTIPEAARLVLQAGGLASNNNVYVLDMGQPVKIVDLARDMVQLSGARDVEIVFTGTRPGEKLYEELLTAGEQVSRTAHKDIMVAALAQPHPERFAEQLAVIECQALEGDGEGVRRTIRRLLPESTVKVNPDPALTQN